MHLVLKFSLRARSLTWLLPLVARLKVKQLVRNFILLADSKVTTKCYIVCKHTVSWNSILLNTFLGVVQIWNIKLSEMNTFEDFVKIKLLEITAASSSKIFPITRGHYLRGTRMINAVSALELNTRSFRDLLSPHQGIFFQNATLFAFGAVHQLLWTKPV